MENATYWVHKYMTASSEITRAIAVAKLRAMGNFMYS